MWEDEKGADTIPLKLVVYLAIAGMVIIMAATGLNNAQPHVDRALMERQMEDVKSSLNRMQSGYARPISDPGAPAGNIRRFELILPESLEYISFGADPDPDNNGILTDTPSGLITDDGNAIYYKLRNGGKTTVILDDDVHIREGMKKDNRWIIHDAHQALVLTGSRQSVTFELVHDHGTTYTISHLTDDLDVYINPDTGGGLPHGLLLSIYPDWIPADNETAARVTVQIIDGTGERVQSEGHCINLTSSKGELSDERIITNSLGSGSVFITSDELGLGVINAISPGLHEAAGEIAFTLPSAAVEFHAWINYSEGGGDPSERIADFYIAHDAAYSVKLTGWGTKARWPLSPEGWPICRIEVDGMIVGEREVASGSRIDVPYGELILSEGTHTVRVTMTNDLHVPFIGDRNVFVEKMEFSKH